MVLDINKAYEAYFAYRVNEYFTQRISTELGITDAQNSIGILKFSSKNATNEIVPMPIFTAGANGIDILVYNLDRTINQFAKGDSRWKTNDYKITRLLEPVQKNGGEMKYFLPKGVSTLPFFPPAIIEAYEQKTAIPILFLTEGYFKAFKASMHGIFCIGLPSITCMKDKETGGIFPDILKLINTCKVDKIVWLVDGDCRNISTKDISNKIDLAKRPNQFFNTVSTFTELLSSLPNINKYFAHINTYNLEAKPKGLDDLLCALPNEIDAIVKDFYTFDKIKAGKYESDYIIKFDVTHTTGKIYKYFLLHDVVEFYLHHVLYREDLKGTVFNYKGTMHQYNEADGKCEIKVPADASLYFRVGDDYHEYVEIPNQYQTLERTFHKRSSATIKQDHGVKIFNHIPKYKAFCNVPSHTAYSRVINSCFNLYFPFEHEPEEGDCEATLNYVKHIFGTEEKKYTGKDGTEHTVTNYDLAIDYLTILYKYPQQILPILCLVSKDWQTGKTTFINWLERIFTANMAIVSNEDLQNSFNAHWISKLIIACDETMIDSVAVIEKIKALSTAKSAFKNGKGTNQDGQAFFGKFILLSNNEENFIRVDNQEIRFWINKVQTIPNLDTELSNTLIDEIPAFLNYINKRPISTQKLERHWFSSKLLITDALKAVQKNSTPQIQKLFTLAMQDLFEGTLNETLYFPLAELPNIIKGKYKYDLNQITNMLDRLGYKTTPQARRKYPRRTEIRGQNNTITEAYEFIEFNKVHYTFMANTFNVDVSLFATSTETLTQDMF